MKYNQKQIIKLMFELKEKSFTYLEIANALNERHLFTIRGRRWSEKNAKVFYNRHKYKHQEKSLVETNYSKQSITVKGFFDMFNDAQEGLKAIECLKQEFLLHLIKKTINNSTDRKLNLSKLSNQIGLNPYSLSRFVENQTIFSELETQRDKNSKVILLKIQD